jgi:hypothetical protein
MAQYSDLSADDVLDVRRPAARYPIRVFFVDLPDPLARAQMAQSHLRSPGRAS